VDVDRVAAVAVVVVVDAEDDEQVSLKESEAADERIES
jgi:hypothetical protein